MKENAGCPERVIYAITSVMVMTFRGRRGSRTGIYEYWKSRLHDAVGWVHTWYISPFICYIKNRHKASVTCKSKFIAHVT